MPMMMKTFTVRGGDFPPNEAGHFQEGRKELLLPPHDRALYPAGKILNTAPATKESITLMGGEQRFGGAEAVEGVLADAKARKEDAFVVHFTDGKVLLGTA